MFVMASLIARSASGPVRVRNLSSTGALIEGAVIPASGERVHLRRAGATVAGEVVWSRDGRAGLRFDSRITVENWLPLGTNCSAQQRVDEVVQGWKIGARNAAPSTANGIVHADSISAVALTNLCEEIQTLANDLAGDDAIVQRHLAKLQTLDTTAQVLRKLADALLRPA